MYCHRALAELTVKRSFLHYEFFMWVASANMIRLAIGVVSAIGVLYAASLANIAAVAPIAAPSEVSYASEMLCRYKLGKITVKDERSDGYSCVVIDPPAWQTYANWCQFPRIEDTLSNASNQIICDGYIVPENFTFCVPVDNTTVFINKCSP
jgi:hypothetical protein